jgi:hypothetical protein
MTLSRAISLSAHAALELALGLAFMAAPIVLGAGTAACVAAIPLGAIVVGLALAGATTGERGSLSVSSHAVYDWAMGVGLVGAGAILAVTGDATAFAVYATTGLAMLLLHATTRYTPSPA